MRNTRFFPSIKMAALPLTALFFLGFWAVLPEAATAEELFMYCGAGLRQPVDELLDVYRQETGVKVNVEFGGSGQLLARIKATGKGDVFLPGSQFYVDRLKESNEVSFSLPVVLHIPVVAVNKRKAEEIKTFADLAKPGVRVGLGDPKAMALGRTAEDILVRSGLKDAILKNTVVRAATVKQLTLYVVNGDVDAAIISRADAFQNKKNVVYFDIDPSWFTPEIVTAATLKSSTNPEAARKLAEFLASPRAVEVFGQYGFLPVPAKAAGGYRVVTDALGRKVTIPREVRSVISTCPTITTIVYMLTPDKLLGWNFKPDRRNMPEKYRGLPVLGGWFGLWSGNYETMISMHPDVILYETSFDNAAHGDLEVLNERQRKFGSILVLGIFNSGDLHDLDKVVLFLGDVLNARDKAEALVRSHRTARDTVAKRVGGLPSYKRTRVYYAEGVKGLLTDPEGSRHSILIGMCGGVNIATCPLKKGSGGMGQTEVSIEQVLAWDPDVIITENPKFFNSVFKDPVWSKIGAVREHRVYLTPRGPFCWFDRPPGASTIPGILWTAKKLQPELFADIDLKAMTKSFYQEFYHYNLSEQEIDRLIDPKVGVSPGYLPQRPQK